MKKRAYKVMQLKRVSSHGMRWDPDGACWRQVKDGPWKRYPESDFGTQLGDLLVDPWIQELLAGKVP